MSPTAMVPWVAVDLLWIKAGRDVRLWIAAVIRIGRKALLNACRCGLTAAAASSAIYFLHVPFPAIILIGVGTDWPGVRLATRKRTGRLGAIL